MELKELKAEIIGNDHGERNWGNWDSNLCTVISKP